MTETPVDPSYPVHWDNLTPKLDLQDNYGWQIEQQYHKTKLLPLPIDPGATIKKGPTMHETPIKGVSIEDLLIEISRSRDEAHLLFNRLCAVANRLFGPMPSPSTQRPEQPSISGTVNQLSATLIDIQQTLNDIRFQVERLETLISQHPEPGKPYYDRLG